MKRGLFVGLMVVMLVGLVSLAQAGEEKKGVKVGVLKCNEASGWGFVYGSSKSLKCVFSPAEKGAKAVRFTGEIKKYGVDVGYQEHSVILWAVLATSEKVTPGEIAGKYAGATAEVAWAGGARRQHPRRRLQEGLRPAAAQRGRLRRAEPRRRGGRGGVETGQVTARRLTPKPTSC